ETDVLKEFTEFLLRIMGEEAPIDIERQFRERPLTGRRELRQAQLLMATLAALAARFSIVAPTVDTMTSIIERYDNIDNQFVRQLPTLNTLIQVLRKRVRKTTLQPILNAGNPTPGSQNVGMAPELINENIAMATDGLAAWTQMLW